MTRVYNADAAVLSGPARTILEEKGSTVFTIDAAATVYDAVAEMDEKRVGALFVVDGDALVGVITIGDLVHTILALQSQAIERLHTVITGPYPS